MCARDGVLAPARSEIYHFTARILFHLETMASPRGKRMKLAPRSPPTEGAPAPSSSPSRLRQMSAPFYTRYFIRVPALYSAAMQITRPRLYIWYTRTNGARECINLRHRPRRHQALVGRLSVETVAGERGISFLPTRYIGVHLRNDNLIRRRHSRLLSRTAANDEIL